MIKKIFFNTLILLIFSFFHFQHFAYAQNNQQIFSGVNWLSPLVVQDTSIVVQGNIQLGGSPPPQIFYMLEYGKMSSFSENNGEFQVFGENPLGLSNIFSLNSSSPNFNNIVNNLWPSQYYYFVIWECESIQGNFCSKVLDYYVNKTNPVDNVVLNFSPYNTQNQSVTLNGSLNLLSANGTNIATGMPLDLYVLDYSLSSTQASNLNDVDPSAVVAAMSVLVAPNGSFVVNLSNIQMDTQYHIKILNSDSGLSILNNDVPVMFDQSNSGQNNNQNNQNTGGQGSSGQQNQFSQNSEFSGGIVNCQGPNCTFNDLLVLVNRVIRFIIFVIAVPIITLSFVYAGFLLVTSGGNPSKKDQAKGIIYKAVIGLLILLLSWIIIRTVLIVLGYQGPLIGILGI